MEELTCEKCKAKCCRYISIEVDDPKDKEAYEEILWYLVHKNVEVFIEEGKWHIQFNTDCKNLDKDFKCKIYDKRPNVCKEHDIECCEKHGEDDPKDISFSDTESFMKYMEKRGVKRKV